MRSINIKLCPVKDRDIIDYLKSRPKTYIIKTALRELMDKGTNVIPKERAQDRVVEKKKTLRFVGRIEVDD